MESLELGIRGWMIIIGVLLILAVILDGYRRMRNDRYGKIRWSGKVGGSLDKDYEGEDAAEMYGSELPNGGARVVERRNEPSLGDASLMDAPVVDGSLDSRDGDRMAPLVGDEHYDADPDPLMDGYVDPADRVPEAVKEPAPAFVNADPIDNDALMDTGTDYDVGSVMGAPDRTTNVSQASNGAPVIEDVNLQPEGAEQLPSKVDEVIVVNVFSKDGNSFAGEDLLHILLACDCRYGKMNIFHRYEQANAQGPIQFSVANAVEPGVFDLDNIKSFSTPGITFFLQLPGPEAPLKALDFMLETAQCVANNLKGELRDEARSAMTAQTLEHCRQRIRDYERKRLVQRA